MQETEASMNSENSAAVSAADVSTAALKQVDALLEEVIMLEQLRAAMRGRIDKISSTLNRLEGWAETPTLWKM
jgi:hypothetical protein